MRKEFDRIIENYEEEIAEIKEATKKKVMTIEESMHGLNRDHDSSGDSLTKVRQNPNNLMDLFVAYGSNILSMLE